MKITSIEFMPLSNKYVKPMVVSGGALSLTKR